MLPGIFLGPRMGGIGQNRGKVGGARVHRVGLAGTITGEGACQVVLRGNRVPRGGEGGVEQVGGLGGCG